MKQGVSGAVAQRDNEVIPTKPLISWWARQDSNLQPDRYELDNQPAQKSACGDAMLEWRHSEREKFLNVDKG
jgi:hypothetical protein